MRKLSFLLALVMMLSVAAYLVACTPDKADSKESTEESDSGAESGELGETTFAGAFAIQQVGRDQAIKVSYNDDISVEKLEITVTHGDQTVATKTVEGDDLSDSVTVDGVYYGKHTVSIKATNDAEEICEVSAEMDVFADEYVIAPISGSMPQLYFTLYMDEITANHTIPAFVWLARPDSWNWDNLPDNVYPMPTVDISEVLVHNNYDRMVEVTDAYIEELYSINPDAKFNLYINDYNAYLYMKLLVGNGIPEDNYYVTLLSDGGASVTSFNSVFNKTTENFDADAVYADMAGKLETLYTEVAEAGDYGNGTFTVNTSQFRDYAYVAAKEMDNVEWWLPRPRADVLCSPDEEFINTVLNVDTLKNRVAGTENYVIMERNFSSPLVGLTEEQEAALKGLYNFNGDLFEAAHKDGKKAMMILGSWARPANEPDFESYVKMVKAYFGDEYVYFYKGHPNTPTAMYPDKQAQLEELDLVDVESSINAELILFFYPDIYMCGYDSSTFASVQSEQMACAMFNTGKDDAYANANMSTYCELMGFYATKIADPANSAYASIATEADHTYFLMEFNRDDKPADIGIYDATADTITYYNVGNDGFELVNS